MRATALHIGLAALEPGNVTINVGGELEDGRAFFGTDTVRAIHSP